MKTLYKKIVGGGTKSLVLSLLFSMMLSVPAFAEIPSGTNVNYTSSNPGVNQGQATFIVEYGGNEYTGSCAEFMKENASSGRAKVNKLSNSSKIAKIVYLLAVEEEYWNNASKGDNNAREIIGVNTSYFRCADIVTAMTQIYGQGASEWKDLWYYNIDVNGSSAEKSAVDAIVSYYQNFDTSSVVVPAGFEIYYGDAGSDQPFVAWRAATTGPLKLKKASANPSITG